MRKQPQKSESLACSHTSDFVHMPCHHQLCRKLQPKQLPAATSPALPGLVTAHCCYCFCHHLYQQLPLRRCPATLPRVPQSTLPLPPKPLSERLPHINRGVRHSDRLNLRELCTSLTELVELSYENLQRVFVAQALSQPSSQVSTLHPHH